MGDHVIECLKPNHSGWPCGQGGAMECSAAVVAESSNFTSAELEELLGTPVAASSTTTNQADASVPVEQCRYDAFIAYSGENEATIEPVLHQLKEHGVHCWYAKEHLIPGTYVMHSITQAIIASKHTIAFISKSFVQSRWCQLELQYAMQEAVKSKRGVLIPVVMDISPEEIPIELRCLKYTLFDEEELIDKLLQAIKGPNDTPTIGELQEQIQVLQDELRRSTGQLLEIWQGQNEEVLSSIEKMGVRVIGRLASQDTSQGSDMLYSRQESRNESLLEEDAELRNVCSLLSKCLGDSWRELGREFKINTRSLDDISARYEQNGGAELVWAVLEKWAERGEPTKEGLLQAVKNIGQEAILGPPMTDQHRDMLQTLHPYLHKQMMDVELLLLYLRGDKILTSSQIEKILQGRGRFGKIENLLKMLPNLGCRAFDGFVHALEQSGQVHIAKKLREIESMDPAVYGGDQMMTDILSRQLSEKTAVKGIAEDAADTYVQILNTGAVRGLLFDILRYVKQIDTRTGRFEERTDE